MEKQSNKPFLILISVFFFWGFVAASNGILIPVYKEHLHLKQWQTMFIDFAFYISYTIGSLLYLLISKQLKQDLLSKLGYKNGISLGLSISAIGALLFYPAAETESFSLMISGLFIIGLGFSLQQTAANPLVINIGDQSKGAQRLSLAGGINNIGTTIGPILVSLAIFGSLQDGQKLSSLSAVKIPYLILALAFLLAAWLFKTSAVPNALPTTEEPQDQALSKSEKSIWQYPQLWLGMIGIFVYVGVEVSTSANLGEYLKQHLKVDAANVAPYQSLYWGSLMIGRWIGAVGSLPLNGIWKKMGTWLMPYLAYGIILLVNSIHSSDLSLFYPYAGIIPVVIIMDYLSKGNPAKQLILFSLCGIISLITGMCTSGYTSVYAFISVGLFCSTLWPCIFTLAIAGLGKHTNKGSGYLIMMIMGGGIISEIQALLSDKQALGIQGSYIIGVICFVYLAYYGLKAKKILSSQGITYENSSSSGH